MATYSNLEEVITDHLTNLIVIRAQIFQSLNKQGSEVTAVEINIAAHSNSYGIATLKYRREIGASHTPETKVNRWLVKEVIPMNAPLDKFIGSWVSTPPWLEHDPVVFCKQDVFGLDYRLLSTCHPLILQDLARIDMWLSCIPFEGSGQNIPTLSLSVMHARLQGFLVNENRILEDALTALRV